MQFEICTLIIFLEKLSQSFYMPHFQKCPTCGTFALVQANGAFRCENDHVFRLIREEKTNDDEVWNHMPEWTRKLRETSRRFQT